MSDSQMKMQIDVKNWDTLTENTKSFINFVVKIAKLHFIKYSEDSETTKVTCCIYTPMSERKIMNIQFANLVGGETLDAIAPDGDTHNNYLPAMEIDNFTAKNSVLQYMYLHEGPGYSTAWNPICEVQIKPTVNNESLDEDQLVEISSDSFTDNVADFKFANVEDRPVTFSLRTSTFRVVLSDNTTKDIYYKVGVHPLVLSGSESASQTVEEYISHLNNSMGYIGFSPYKNGCFIHIGQASGNKEQYPGDNACPIPARAILLDQEINYLVCIEMHSSADGSLVEDDIQVSDVNDILIPYGSSDNWISTGSDMDFHAMLNVVNWDIDGGLIPFMEPPGE